MSDTTDTTTDPTDLERFEATPAPWWRRVAPAVCFTTAGLLMVASGWVANDVITGVVAAPTKRAEAAAVAAVRSALPATGNWDAGVIGSLPYANGGAEVNLLALTYPVAGDPPNATAKNLHLVHATVAADGTVTIDPTDLAAVQ